MAERTGLEPATPGLTGRYSNQLNYRSEIWWVLRGSNPRPSPCKGDALPAELSTHLLNKDRIYATASAASSTRPMAASFRVLPAFKTGIMASGMWISLFV